MFLQFLQMANSKFVIGRAIFPAMIEKSGSHFASVAATLSKRSVTSQRLTYVRPTIPTRRSCMTEATGKEKHTANSQLIHLARPHDHYFQTCCSSIYTFESHTNQNHFQVNAWWSLLAGLLFWPGGSLTTPVLFLLFLKMFKRKN